MIMDGMLNRTRRSPFLLMMSFSLMICTLLFSGCMKAYLDSVGGEYTQIFERIYLTDYNIAWQAATEALKSMHLDNSSKDSGYLQTSWIDNTKEKNMIDSFGAVDNYLKAQYRFRVNLGQGVYNGRESVKVSVEKQQLISRDAMEGFRPVSTDGIDEKTLLYRVGRIISIKARIAKMEKAKARNVIEKLQESE